VTAPMAVYRRHGCRRTHTSYYQLAKCIWRRSEWVAGNGPFATLAHCRVLTVQLHTTEDAARRALALIDATACGGRCYRDHQLVRLVLP
jgi:hypothetical protein